MAYYHVQYQYTQIPQIIHPSTSYSQPIPAYNPQYNGWESAQDMPTYDYQNNYTRTNNLIQNARQMNNNVYNNLVKPSHLSPQVNTYKSPQNRGILGAKQNSPSRYPKKLLPPLQIVKKRQQSKQNMNKKCPDVKKKFTTSQMDILLS